MIYLWIMAKWMVKLSMQNSSTKQAPLTPPPGFAVSAGLLLHALSSPHTHHPQTFFLQALGPENKMLLHQSPTPSCI